MDKNAALQKRRHFCVAAKVKENSPFLLFINYFIDAFVLSILSKSFFLSRFLCFDPKEEIVGFKSHKQYDKYPAV